MTSLDRCASYLSASSGLCLVFPRALGGLFSVVPHSMLFLVEMRQEVIAIQLNPELSRPIGLIVLNHKALPPLLAAAWSVFYDLDFQPRFDALINVIY